LLFQNTKALEQKSKAFFIYICCMKEGKTKMWFKRIGVAGFFFFLIKGLIWLAVIFGAAEWLKK